MLIVLYFSAAFWKLTTSWFDTHYSCATVLMSELLAGLEPLLPPLALVAEPMLLMAPALVAGIEFAVRTPSPLRLLGGCGGCGGGGGGSLVGAS